MGSIKGQKHNPYIAGRYEYINKNDIVFTPDNIAKKICSMFPIKGKVLEPCKGEGVFLRYLPEGTLWCEIVDGRNYYDFNEKVDWLVTNPPYSDFDRFLDHSFDLADNIVLLTPVAKMMKSMGTLKKIYAYGGMVECHFVGASKCGFPFGFPCGIWYLKRGYKGKTLFKELSLRTNCEFDFKNKPKIGSLWEAERIIVNSELMADEIYEALSILELNGFKNKRVRIIIEEVKEGEING